MDPLYGVLPFTQCRLLRAGEPEFNEDGLPQGIVGRLYARKEAQPLVKAAFTHFEPRRVSLLALALQQVANERGPDALVGVIPGDSPHSVKLRELALSCYEAKQCMVASGEHGDTVLIPRSPACVEEDGFPFLVFLTNLKAADVCDLLRHQAKALVVLDLDNTLVDAQAVAISQREWDALHWQPCSVSTESGRELPAQYALLMEHDPTADAVYVMHWRLGKLACTFKVRIRRGWERLREYLVRERSRFEVFVCSKGKQEYVQLLWHMLDPLSQLFPKTDWDWRLNSTFPDAVPRAVTKTMLIALGCAHPLEPAPPAHLACPVVCFDDCPNAYYEEYHRHVMFVEEYCPSEGLSADTGSVLRQAEQRLEEYWAANYALPAAEASSDSGMDGSAAAAEGEGPWDRLVDGVLEMVHSMLGEPISPSSGLQEQQERCAQLGAWLHERCSVRGVFSGAAYIADVPAVLSPGAAVPSAAAAEAEGKPAPLAVSVEVQGVGEAAAAAEGGPESPCGVLANGKRPYITPEALLCALCMPSGICMPGCAACAELAAAAKAGEAAVEPLAAALSVGLGEPEEELGEEAVWASTASSTPRGGSDASGGDDWGLREALPGLPGAEEPEGGSVCGDSDAEAEAEAAAEAAAAELFEAVSPSLRGMGEMFHMKLARISGHKMIMVPSARTLGRVSVGGADLAAPPLGAYSPKGCDPPGLGTSATREGGRFPANTPKAGKLQSTPSWLSSSPPK